MKGLLDASEAARTEEATRADAVGASEEFDFKRVVFSMKGLLDEASEAARTEEEATRADAAGASGKFDFKRVVFSMRGVFEEANAEAARTEAARTEAARTEAARAETARAETARAEKVWNAGMGGARPKAMYATDVAQDATDAQAMNRKRKPCIKLFGKRVCKQLTSASTGASTQPQEQH